MDFNQAKDALLILLGSGLVYILKGIKESVDKLNIQIAVVIHKTNDHEKRIEKLEDKI